MDDEISLSDLWNTLVRRRRTIAITTLVFTLAAGAYAFLKPVQYNYNTALEIGSYPVETENGRDRRLIEPSENVERKLRLAYIPLARSQMGNTNTNTKNVPRVTLGKESGSPLFILTSQGTTEARSDIAELHQRILDLLIADNNKALHNLIEQQQSKIRTQQAELAHQSQKSVQQAHLKALEEQHQKAIQKRDALDQDYAVTLANLDAQQQSIETDLLDNKATREQLKAGVKRIDEREQLLNEQITAIQHRLAQLQKQRDAAVAQTSQNANAVAVLMVGSEVSQTERQLWQLRNSLTIDLAAEREELARKLTNNKGNETKRNSQLAELLERRAGVINQLPGTKLVATAEVERLANDIAKGKQDNQLGISQLKETVGRLESELNDMAATAALYVALRNVDQQGFNRASIIVRGLLLGLALSVLFALAKSVAIAIQPPTK